MEKNYHEIFLMVFVMMVQHEPRSRRLDQFRSGVRAGCAHDVQAETLADLDRRQSRATAGSVHQSSLALFGMAPEKNSNTTQTN